MLLVHCNRDGEHLGEGLELSFSDPGWRDFSMRIIFRCRSRLRWALAFRLLQWANFAGMCISLRYLTQRECLSERGMASLQEPHLLKPGEPDMLN